MTIAAIVLAGERAGGNQLAREHGVAAGVLLKVAGTSCIARVLTALRASQLIGAGHVVGPSASVCAGEPTLNELFLQTNFSWHAPASGPSASALEVVLSINSFPVLLTTGDHALLTPAIVHDFYTKAHAIEADFVVGLVPFALVRDAYPESQRTCIRFRDGVYCGSNLFLVKHSKGAKVLKFWNALESERKRPWRIAARLGFGALWRFLVTGLNSAAAFELLSRRCEARIAFVELTDPTAAIDVDSSADLVLADKILRHG